MPGRDQPRHLTGAPASQGGRYRADPKPGGVVDLAAARDAKQLADALDALRNGLREPLTEDARARVVALLEGPTRETWDDGRGVLIGGHTTVWQALLKHTDFDTTIAATDELVEEGFHPFRPSVYKTAPKGDIPTSDQMRAALLAVADDLREQADTPE